MVGWLMSRSLKIRGACTVQRGTRHASYARAWKPQTDKNTQQQLHCPTHYCSIVLPSAPHTQN